MKRAINIYARIRTHLSTLDVAYVQGFCQKATKDLAGLQSQMYELHAAILESICQLAQLSCAVTQRHARVNAAKSLLASIRVLLTEILTLIFEMCVTNDIFG